MASAQPLRYPGRGKAKGLPNPIVLSERGSVARTVGSTDALIVMALEELCRTEGADHAGWFLLSKATGIVDGTNCVSTTKAFGTRNSFDAGMLPWCKSRLLSGCPVLLAGLDDLPARAEVDRTFLLNAGVRSMALLPMDDGELHVDVVAILSLKKSKRWSSNLVKRCAMLNEAFFSARTHSHDYFPNDAKFREAFRTAPVGMALEDLSGGLLYVNESLCAMLGYSETEMLQKRCLDFSHPDDVASESILFAQLLNRERQCYEIEKRFLRSDSSIVWGKVSVSLLTDDPDRPPMVLGMVEDITPRKAVLEKLASSQLEVQALASRIVLSQEDERRMIARELHDDIGQRLSLITSEVHLLHSAPKGKPRIPSLVKLTEELDTLVTDLHNLSHRLHSSKQQHLGLNSTLREICGRFSRAGLAVDLRCDGDMGCLPENLAICLLRIVEEALQNVRKHSGANEATVVVAKQIDGYRMVIADTGVGFVNGGAGRGLGLTSMRERVRSLNGRLHISWRRDAGARVVVWLPFEEEITEINPPVTLGKTPLRLQQIKPRSVSHASPFLA
jgi:PAS domain S-box-containing protein